MNADEEKSETSDEVHHLKSLTPPERSLVQSTITSCSQKKGKGGKAAVSVGEAGKEGVRNNEKEEK